MKSRRVCIKTKSTPASLPLKGQVTKHTTIIWTIPINYLKSIYTGKICFEFFQVIIIIIIIIIMIIIIRIYLHTVRLIIIISL